MSFKAFEEVHGDQSLHLPIRGKEYRIWPPTADVGYALAMRLAAGVAIQAGVEFDDETLAEANAAVQVADEQLPEFGRQCLGAAYDEMLADGLSFPEVEMASQTAFLAWTVDREVAEEFWNSGGKALRRREIHPALRRTETPTPTGGESTTPTPESPSGTRRKARAKANKAVRSTGTSRTTTT